MLTHTTSSALTSLVLLSFFCISPLQGQHTWKVIELSARGKTLTHLKAIGVSAKAECDGKHFDAFVFAWGRAGSGICTLGVVVKGFDGIVANSELDHFRGPDLSEKALQPSGMSVRLEKGKSINIYNTCFLMGSTLMLQDNIRGAAKEYFQSNAPFGRMDAKKWNEFLIAFSEGFDVGYVIIGENSLSKIIKVSFGGVGVVPLAVQLSQFVSKK